MSGKKNNKAHANTSATKPASEEESKKVDWFKIASAIIVPVVVAALSYYGVITTVYAPIWATQTAQAQSLSLTQTSQADQSFTSGPVPTETALPVSTSTPTLEIIPLPSSTLEPRVSFAAPRMDDLNKLPTLFGGYTDPNTPDTYTYYLSVHANQSFFWKYQWCAKYQGALNENMSDMKFSFLMNENPIPETKFLTYDHNTPDGWSCHIWVTMLTNWMPGEKTTLTVQYETTELVSDGENTYPPGLYRHDLVITVKP